MRVFREKQNGKVRAMGALGGSQPVEENKKQSGKSRTALRTALYTFGVHEHTTACA
jgi:hypothetical protein